MTPKRRESDKADAQLALPAHMRRQLEMTDEERTSLIDALRVALHGPHRRAGDEKRWRDMLTRLGSTWTQYHG